MRARHRAQPVRMILGGALALGVTVAVAVGVSGALEGRDEVAQREALQLEPRTPSTAGTGGADGGPELSAAPATEDPAVPAARPTAPSVAPSGSDEDEPGVDPEPDAPSDDVVIAVVDDALDTFAEITPVADDDVSLPTGAHVRGALVSELEAELAEFAAEGWTRSGSYDVDQVEVLEHDRDANPESVTISACVDSSQIVIRRADGTRQPANPVTRATSIFLLERHDDAWWVAGRSFPDNPTC